MYIFFVYIFCSLSWNSLSLMRGSYFNKKLQQVPILVITSHNGMLTIPHGFPFTDFSGLFHADFLGLCTTATLATFYA